MTLNERFPNLYARLHPDDPAHKELIEFGKYQYDQGKRDAVNWSSAHSMTRCWRSF